jgi:hypothetical protein
MAACAAAGAELEALVGDMVEHRGALGDADRVLLLRRQRGDPRGEVDLLGLSGDPAHHHFGCRHMAVFDEAVVLAEPGVLPVVLVGEDDVLRLLHQFVVLALGVMRAGPRQVAVEKDSEFH